MINIDKLIESGIDLKHIKVEFSLDDLGCFGREIARKFYEDLTGRTPKEPKCTYVASERVCEILDISRVTLWHLDKRGITHPIRLGNLKRYRLSDIESLGQHDLTNSYDTDDVK